MEILEVSRSRKLLLVVSAALVVWGVLGALDIRNQTYTGYATDGNNTITRVTDGSPADVAGLETGDYIRSIGGIPVENARALAARPRPEIGETWTLVVEQRDPTVLASGEEAPATESIDITYRLYGHLIQKEPPTIAFKHSSTPEAGASA